MHLSHYTSLIYSAPSTKNKICVSAVNFLAPENPSVRRIRARRVMIVINLYTVKKDERSAPLTAGWTAPTC